ncbi:MAG TPA: pyridoxal-phosphate dependent enzyme [Halobacteriales archaeon]|nr:pyridoxal-phosphate dependent enzyme [Halobacteriales archaeon]
METTDAFDGLVCRDCEARHEPADAPGRCPDCGGILRAEYDLRSVDEAAFEAARGPDASIWRFADLLPFPPDAAVSIGEGGTPLVDCPRLADELGVERVLVKDEGQNPTGSVADRGLSVAVTAAAAAGATDVALQSAGNDGHAAAAYAGRAGLASHVFVPTRSGFVQKAMINVHGGDMSVVEGRLPEAKAAYEEALAGNEGWHPVAPFAEPYRLQGRKTVLYEVVTALGEVPDAIVHPTGEGAGIAGAYEAATELQALDAMDSLPALYAAQASGCAPIATAVEADAPVEPVERPVTICADVEVPDPAAGDWVVEAIEETRGGAVATDDPDVLESAVKVAEHEGVPVTPSGATAASGAWALAERGAFEADDTVVLVNTGAGAKTADVLRSHLMSQGV